MKIKSLYRVPYRFTPLPTNIIDEWLPELREAELKVYISITRKTYGFKKEKDAISIEQLMEATGLSRTSVMRATKSLNLRGLLSIKGSERHVRIYEVLMGRCGSASDTTDDTGGSASDTTVVAPAPYTINSRPLRRVK